MDTLTEKFFEIDRWTAAIAKGIGKDIRRDQLYQLAKPEVRAQIYALIRDGRYEVSPPHTALIPKDKPGEFRTVYVNEPVDRIILSILNDLLFEVMPDMVHPRCMSYQKGIGCGRVVREASARVVASTSETVGWKSDLSKYFDSVPLRYIDAVFDRVEERFGKSAILDVVRKYYHSNLYFDEAGELRETYQSLKQGCAVAAFLADAVLYHIDERLSTEFGGYYVRYSDDTLFIGERYEEAMAAMSEELALMEMKLNPKKVEYLTATRWFKFLGYSIKGSMISLSSTRIKTFQKEIMARTVKDRQQSFARALSRVNRFLYKGDGEHSWATQVLLVCNVRKDIDTLNAFVMDALRAVQTKHRRIGGLGFVAERKDSCIDRGTGRNVTANRQKTGDTLDGYLSLGCMQNALRTSKAVYNTLVSQL